MTNSNFRVGLAALILWTGAGSVEAQTDSRRAVDELLALDRSHAKTARSANVIDALGAMFAADVALNAMGSFHFGREAALTRLRAVPESPR